MWIADLSPEAGERAVAELAGTGATFVCDVRDRAQVLAAAEAAQSAGLLRAVVHTSHRAAPPSRMTLVNLGTRVSSAEVVGTKLTGTFNVLTAAGA